jgi:VWFA-related protein
MNETFATRGLTANRLVHDLGSLETADYVYLYLLALDGRLYPVHGLPGAQSDTGPAGDAPWTSRIKPMLDQALRTVLQSRPIKIDIAVRVQMTYLALSSIAVELSRVPGRKAIVWLTDGVPIELGPNRSDTGDFVDFTPLLRQMSEALDRSGVAIYPVRQVMLGSPDNVNGAGSGIGNVATLNAFAELTGGRPDAGKDIGTALRQAVNDTRTSYRIGYYLPAKNWDNKFHKLRVTCTRKGVHIQSKTGYYAWRQAPGAKSEQANNSAISTTSDAAEIGLRATLSPDPAGERRVRLDAHIDARDVVLVHEGDLYNGHLRLAIVGYVPGVDPAREPMIPLDIHYSDRDRDRALEQGIGFAENLTLEENMQAVRLIVFDRASNAIGSVTIPVPAVDNPAAPKAMNLTRMAFFQLASFCTHPGVAPGPACLWGRVVRPAGNAGRGRPSCEDSRRIRCKAGNRQDEFRFPGRRQVEAPGLNIRTEVKTPPCIFHCAHATPCHLPRAGLVFRYSSNS